MILLVMPCTQDLTTSECLELARDADPKRERSLVVITKIDRWEKGYSKQLENDLGLPIIAVRNRT